MDRFSVGLKDSQDMGAAFISRCGCARHVCRESIYEGDECWEYDGELFATPECLVWAVGGNKVVAGMDA